MCTAISLFWLEEWWVPGWVKIYLHSLVFKSFGKFHVVYSNHMIHNDVKIVCIRAKGSVQQNIILLKQPSVKTKSGYFEMSPACNQEKWSRGHLIRRWALPRTLLYIQQRSRPPRPLRHPTSWGRRSAGVECCVLEGSKATLRIPLNFSSFELLTPQGNLFCKEHLPGLVSQSRLLAASKALSARGRPCMVPVRGWCNAKGGNGQ